MRKFIIEIFIFSAILGISFYVIFCQADGYTDAFYIRFTSPKQSSLILGTSRSAQALQPKVFNEILDRNDFFNYSFTILHSPYGKTYYESVKRKLKHTTENGIFIISVNPWSISSTTNNPNETEKFREKNSILSNRYVHINPNIFYLYQYYDDWYLNILRNLKRYYFLHTDGWLEVNVPMDSNSIRKRTEEKLVTYRKDNLPIYKFSSIRYHYLVQMIKYLKGFGVVYLVRLPVHHSIAKIENTLSPEFNKLIEQISLIHNVKYLNFENESMKYNYTDGNHLWKEDGEKVTKKIAESVLNDFNLCSY